MSEGNWKGATVPVRFVVYEDALGNKIITLPRELETVLAGAYQARLPDQVVHGSFWCGKPLPIQNQWYSFTPEGPGNTLGSDAYQGIKRVSGRYTTFADWDTSMRLRLKFDVNESPGGTVIFRGRFEGSKRYTSGVEGVPLAFTTGADVTTVVPFDEPPYQIIKPVTKGRVKLFTVDADDVETLVGYYDPDETDPSYVRFVVPVCPEEEEA